MNPHLRYTINWSLGSQQPLRHVARFVAPSTVAKEMLSPVPRLASASSVFPTLEGQRSLKFSKFPAFRINPPPKYRRRVTCYRFISSAHPCNITFTFPDPFPIKLFNRSVTVTVVICLISDLHKPGQMHVYLVSYYNGSTERISRSLSISVGSLFR